MFAQITNRVAVVQLASANPNADRGIDIVALVRDSNGAPVAGRSLSCWIRSTCGLVKGMVPGWSDTFTWLTIASATPGVSTPPEKSQSSLSEISLPSYCGDAGYPQYVRLVFVESPPLIIHAIFLAGL